MSWSLEFLRRFHLLFFFLFFIFILLPKKVIIFYWFLFHARLFWFSRFKGLSSRYFGNSCSSNIFIIEVAMFFFEFLKQLSAWTEIDFWFPGAFRQIIAFPFDFVLLNASFASFSKNLFYFILATHLLRSIWDYQIKGSLKTICLFIYNNKKRAYS